MGCLAALLIGSILLFLEEGGNHEKTKIYINPTRLHNGPCDGHVDRL
jgi:hypothetical protein